MPEVETLTADEVRHLLERAARATLLPLDRRAIPTYDVVGVDHRLV
jgi:hypothetical protein